MTVSLRDRSLRALSHPVTVAAALVLALNALVFQPLMPSWWTGKIGGVAWLLVSPWLALTLLSLALPARARGAWGEAVLVAIAAGYALVKAAPAVNATVVDAITWIGFRPKLSLDPSDLLALPAVVIAYAVWRTTAPPRGAALCPAPSTPVRAGALFLAAVAMIADSPAPQYFGPRCLVADADSVRAYTLTSVNGYFQPNNGLAWNSVYVSRDGGQTWNQEAVDDQAPDVSEPCAQLTWPVEVTDGRGSLYYVEGQGLYISEDGGITLSLEQSLRAVYSASVDPDSGLLVVAAGEDGLFVRSTDGVWTLAGGLFPHEADDLLVVG